MIPEAAVEAAAQKLGELNSDAGDQLSDKDWALELLEAAAPHMRELQWGVRDRHSLMIACHPSEESARTTAAEHPEWYEVVSRPMPGLWTAK